MHVGFITPEYPHEELSKIGGLGTSLKNLTMSLKSDGINVTVFVVSQSLEGIFNDNGITIHSIKARRYPFLQWYFSRKFYNDYINRVVDKEGIDILEAPDWTGITALMRFKCPLIIRFHGSDTYFCRLENRRQKFKNRFIEKLGMESADAFIAPTTFAGELTKRLFKISKKRIDVIHHGLFLEKFANSNPENYVNNTILYFGTLIRKKGVFELVKIFNVIVERNEDVQLILIGNDSADIKTKSSSTWELMKIQFSEKALKQVDYKGKVPYEEVQMHIKSAHVCVFPTFAETLGMVTIESMALQKPVVNSDFGWAQELIDDSVNGYLVNPKNIELYADRILSIIKDKSLTDSLGKAAREKVESTFNIKTLVKENIAFYKTVIEK